MQPIVQKMNTYSSPRHIAKPPPMLAVSALVGRPTKNNMGKYVKEKNVADLSSGSSANEVSHKEQKLLATMKLLKTMSVRDATRLLSECRELIEKDTIIQ